MTKSDVLEALGAEWVGWEWQWTGGVGPVCVDGPGEVADWDAWEAACREELRAAAVAVAARHGHGPRYDEALADAATVPALARAYGERCQERAAMAAEEAAFARAALEAGDLREALARVAAAARIEREYGDAPAYGRAEAMLREFVAAAEAAE